MNQELGIAFSDPPEHFFRASDDNIARDDERPIPIEDVHARMGIANDLDSESPMPSECTLLFWMHYLRHKR